MDQAGGRPARREVGCGHAVDWCKAQGIRTVVLHSSDAGRGLYEALRFVGTNEMRLMI